MAEIELNHVRLLPVLEFEPGRFSTKTRPLPSLSGAALPDEWNRYWLDSLADSEITGLRTIRPSSWHVATSEFEDSRMLERVLNKIFAEWGGVQSLVDPDSDPVLDGGLALLDIKGHVLVEPQCCVDLRNFSDWQEAAGYRGGDWQMLWIGHPWLSVRFVGGKLVISDMHESKEPIGNWTVDPDDLERALLGAKEELQRFASKIDPILSSQGFTGNSMLMAEKLVGLRATYRS